MARLPPTRKYRKRKPGRDRPLPPPGKGELRIRQVRSGIGRPAFERRTLEALGLKHHQAVVVKQDRPSLRGMLYQVRSEEHTSELQSQSNLVCRLLLEKTKTSTHRPRRGSRSPRCLRWHLVFPSSPKHRQVLQRIKRSLLPGRLASPHVNPRASSVMLR